MPYEPNALLDLEPGIGQRGEAVRVDLLTRSGVKLRSLPLDVSRASIRYDTTGNIKRSLSGCRISSAEWEQINPFSDVVAPYWLLSDGSRWPLGRFRFTGGTDDGQMVDLPPLFDSGIVLDALTDRPFGLIHGASVTDAIKQILIGLGFYDHRVQGSSAVIGDDQPIAWPAGEQNWSTILDYLCDLAGFPGVWFDRHGIPQAGPWPPLSLGASTIRYSTAGGRVQPRWVRDPNLLDAPNAHVVISTGATTEPIYAVSYVDASLPFSRESRGYTVPEVHRIQGIADTAQAEQIARSKAEVSATAYETVEFDGPPDPRHDLFEVIALDGIAYREISGSLQLQPGGNHSHRLARTGLI